MRSSRSCEHLIIEPTGQAKFATGIATGQAKTVRDGHVSSPTRVPVFRLNRASEWGRGLGNTPIPELWIRRSVVRAHPTVPITTITAHWFGFGPRYASDPCTNFPTLYFFGTVKG